jgi:Spy/CpxP family protein refolding chaperone
MSTLFKNKILAGLVILLLIANIFTIVVFFMGMKKMHPAPQQASTYIIKELSLNDKQQEQYKAMVQQHRAQSRLIQEQVRDNKDSFFNLLANENVKDSIKNHFASKISLLNRELDLATFDHFKEVRKICTPDQQKKFDGIIKDVLRIMSGPGPHGQRPGGPDEGMPPPPGDGPPPPSN